MALLSRATILAASDREYDTVACPEWGGEVRVQSISGRQRDEYEQSMLEQKGGDRRVNMRNARAKLVVLCAVDEHGVRLFTPEDVNRLSAKNAKPLDRLFERCQQLAGLSDADIEEMTGNFDEIPDEGLDSD